MNTQNQVIQDGLQDDDEDDAMDIATLGAFAYALNDAHFIRFERRGPGLLVQFQPVAGDDALSDRPARLDDLARDMNWSVLTLLSRGDTWFRSPEVIQFFDALVDGTLLDQFADVLFYGQGSGAHGALSYALTAPGARILALAPHIGFGAPGAPEDARFSPPSGTDFTARYRVETQNLATSRAVWVLFDPTVDEDRAHASALDTGSVTPLACRHMGSDIEAGLAELGLLEELAVRALEGDLTPPVFYRALRVRRDEPAWLRRLIARLIEKERPILEALAVRNVAQRTGRYRFARRYEQIESDLAARGIRIPPSHRAG